MIKKVDFSKFAKEASNSTKPSSLDNPLFYMAKAMIPNLPPKFKCAIGVVIYLILMGVFFNIYLIYKLIF